MKSVMSVVLSVFLSVGSVVGLTSWHQQVAAEAQTHLRKASWALTDATGDPFCSGTFIKPNVFLTAAHCEQPVMKVGHKEAKVIKKDEKLDLMLLYVFLDSPTVQVSATQPAVDTKVKVVGYPLGIGQYLTEGLVQAYEDKGSRMALSAPIIFGNSGGGVFALVDGEYKLVGVASAVWGTFFGPVPHMSIAIDVEAINEFINR